MRLAGRLTSIARVSSLGYADFRRFIWQPERDKVQQKNGRWRHSVCGGMHSLSAVYKIYLVKQSDVYILTQLIYLYLAPYIDLFHM